MNHFVCNNCFGFVRLCSGLPKSRANSLLGIIVVHKQRPANKPQVPVKMWMYAERSDTTEPATQDWKLKAAKAVSDVASFESPMIQVSCIFCRILVNVSVNTTLVSIIFLS